MSNYTQRVQYWELDNHEKLENLLPLLSLNYNSEENGFMMNHHWVVPQGNLIYVKDVDGTNIKYMTVNAEVQVLQVDRERINEVPIDLAFSTKEVIITFVEIGGPIKVLISGPANCFSKIRTKLMKFKRDPKDPKTNLWGKISCPKDYFSKSFFFWLISKSNQIIKIGDEEFSLSDIEGFKCFVERTLQNYKGVGQRMDTQVPLQSMVSLNNNFLGLNLVLDSELYHIKFAITSDLEATLNYSSHKKGQQIEFLAYIELILKIYFRILPEIHRVFNTDKEWITREEEFKKEYGLKAIKQIIDECGLSKDNIDSSCYGSDCITTEQIVAS